MKTIPVALILLTLGAVYAQDRECEDSELGYACKKQMTDFFALHWSLGPTRAGATAGGGEIAMALVGKTTGWVGVSFPEKAGTMAPSDAVLGWVESGDVVVNVYRPKVNFISSDELVEDVKLSKVKGKERAGTTTIQFVRTLSSISVPISLNKRIPVNVAIGKSDRLRYHGFGSDRRASLFVNLGKAKRGAGRKEDDSETEEASLSSPTVVTAPSPAPDSIVPPALEPFPLDPPSPSEPQEVETVKPSGRPGMDCTPSDREYDCMREVSSLMTIHWTAGPADATDDAPEISEGEVAMALVGRTSGWVGVSFAEVPGDMIPADAVIGWVTDTDVTVLPYRVTARTVTTADEDRSIGIREISGSVEDDVTTISFVWTGDFTFDVDLSRRVNMNWAVGPTDSLRYHGPSNRGSFSVNLSPREMALDDGLSAELATEPDGSEENLATALEDEMPTLLTSSDAGCPPSDLGYSCMTDAGSPVFVHWTLGPSPASGDVPEVFEGEVAMAIVTATDGWVGISFAEVSGSMAPADAIIGWVTETGATVNPYRVTVKDVSPDDEDPSIGIRETSGTEEGGNTTIRFIATGSFNFDVDFEKAINMNWAVGPSDDLIQHTIRGSFEITL